MKTRRPVVKRVSVKKGKKGAMKKILKNLFGRKK